MSCAGIFYLTNKNVLRVINTKQELVSRDGNCEEKNISHIGKNRSSSYCGISAHNYPDTK